MMVMLRAMYAIRNPSTLALLAPSVAVKSYSGDQVAWPSPIQHLSEQVPRQQNSRKDYLSGLRPKR